MEVLTVNAGSSSVRLGLFTACPDELRRAAEERSDLTDGPPEPVLRAFLERAGRASVDAVAHRVVHGGPRLSASCPVSPEVEAEIERNAPLAPLHNPVALAWIRLCRRVLGAGVLQVAVFDTAFFADLPQVAATYALPRELALRHGFKRYGFHGIAHRALWRRWCELRPEHGGRGRVVTLQLGAGCSAAAIRDGAAQDTSMGYTPLEGLMMATRCGDLDPGLSTRLQTLEGLDPERVERVLNAESGLLGVSGTSADMRDLLASQAESARLAVALYCYRARKYVGAYMAVLGGVDAVVFGGGVGEHSPEVRERILGGMGWSGLRLDPKANASALGREAPISTRESPIEAWVIPVEEARVLAEEALAAGRRRHGPGVSASEEG